MKNNNKGFSLPLAMGLVIIISLLAGSILEYIIPFGKDIKGIENSGNAFYLANSGVEEALLNVYIRNNSGAINNTTEYSDATFNGNINTKYNTISSGSLLPPMGEGQSEYDSDWNTISSGNPIQLVIGNGYFESSADDMKIFFRVPNLDGNNNLTLSGDTLPIVNWQLSATTNTLNASGSIIKASDVDGIEIVLDNLQGVDLNGNEGNDEIFNNFYGNNCALTNSGCTLKFSIINRLETNNTDPIQIPFLEWKLTTGNSVIPLRYTKIESSGKSYGYKKNLEIKVASQTVNEAFDFTVFQ